MYNLEDITDIHFEGSERCNVRCLMCGNNENGKVYNRYLKKRDLSFDAIKFSFDMPFVRQLKSVYFCGNYGEPTLNPELYDILKFFKVNRPGIATRVITNGGTNNTEWWSRLAEVSNSVRFSIDGLEDTHKLYRQGANFNKIINHAKAYIDAGGKAIWDYLVFGHNEHQIEEARKMANDLGFKEFIVKKTGRFFSNLQLENKDEHCGITKPKNKENLNKAYEKTTLLIEKYGSMENYLNRCDILCKAIKKKEIFISAEGLVFPCCWLGDQLYKWFLPEKSTPIWKLFEKDEIDINKNKIQDIFNSGFFKRISDTWEIKSCDAGRLKTCTLKCGSELDQFEEQFK
jgi:MoaA/NifB/PqqE/SkfB family radical SAM enzyme